MKIERTKNAVRNIAFGGIQKIYMLAVPFLMRTLMIYYMGVQYLGLSSLFSSILQVLNLAELGVGNAMVYSMYKPIAEDDEETICALMKLYRTYYRIIGGIIAVVGIILLPFIPNLISQDSLNSLPYEINVYILYVLNLATTVLTYWLFAYKNSILNAYQRNDIISKISIVTTTIQYGTQIAAICFLHDYYIYLIAALATQIMNNIVTAVIASKMFPNYKPEGDLEKTEVKKINRRIADLFTAKIGGVVTYSADTIVVSAFLGLTVLAIYQNYYYILTAVTGILSVITAACTAGIGNSFIVESKEKNYGDLRKFTFIIMWICGFCCCCFLNLYQPFMKIWVGEDLMFEFPAVVLFCVYFLSFELNAFLSVFKDAAGKWHEDRFRPLITALANLTLNIILVQICGIYGVIASTFISQLIISIPWLNRNLFFTVYEKKYCKSYLLQLVRYAIVIFIACAVSYCVCRSVFIQNDWGTLIVRFVICLLTPNLLFFVFYFNKAEFKQSIELVKRILKRG